MPGGRCRPVERLAELAGHTAFNGFVTDVHEAVQPLPSRQTEREATEAYVLAMQQYNDGEPAAEPARPAIDDKTRPLPDCFLATDLDTYDAAAAVAGTNTNCAKRFQVYRDFFHRMKGAPPTLSSGPFSLLTPPSLVYDVKRRCPAPSPAAVPAQAAVQVLAGEGMAWILSPRAPRRMNSEFSIPHSPIPRS